MQESTVAVLEALARATPAVAILQTSPLVTSSVIFEPDPQAPVQPSSPDVAQVPQARKPVTVSVRARARARARGGVDRDENRKST